MKLLVLFVVVGSAVGLALLPAQDQGRRSTLRKSDARVESPARYQMRVRVNRETGASVEYDPRPRVVPVDEKIGLYDLRWIGYDGNEKSIRYQRPDAIDVIVSADVTATTSGRLTYAYNVESLKSSAENLSGFAVQTFASDVRPVETPNVFVGRLRGPVFQTGSWLRFAPLAALTPQVTPGRAIAFALESAAPPGLVECRAHGGPIGLKGVGEEMPFELESVMLAHAAWPKGYTIGPDDRLIPMSSAERRRKIVTWLPEFQRLGWMTPDARARYERTVVSAGAPELRRTLAADVRAQTVTAEVAAVIRELLKDTP